jgi:glyoxylase-like metal-dependent hydrolase (beta-lactamase superfamily II)
MFVDSQEVTRKRRFQQFLRTLDARSVKMKNFLRTLSLFLTAAMVLFVPSFTCRLWAQTEPGKDPIKKPLATTFNPATDKLDRTSAGPITRPMILEIAYNTDFINEFGMDAQYLLVGSNRALLIDTGTGFYDLKGTVEKLTKLPYDVVITHGHPDHAGGMREFATVWIGPGDIEMAKSHDEKGAKTYGEIIWNMPIGYKDVWGYAPADAKWGNWDKTPEFKPLSDGQTFDLGGGRIVTVYSTPGHTPGASVFLDRKTRILFTGDAANPNLLASTLPIITTLRSLLKIKNLAPEYDRIYNGHTAYGGTIDAFPQDPRVLDDLIANCRGLLKGELKGKTVPNFLFPSRTNTVSVYGSAQIVFDPDKLWVEGEPHVIP